MYRVEETYRIFNTWMGDPGKLLLLEAALNYIKCHNILSLVKETGDRLKIEMLKLECEFPFLLNSTRGRGTLLSVNAECAVVRDNIIQKMKKKGCNYIFRLKIFSLCLSVKNRSYMWRMWSSHYSFATFSSISRSSCMHIFGLLKKHLKRTVVVE